MFDYYDYYQKKLRFEVLCHFKLLLACGKPMGSIFLKILTHRQKLLTVLYHRVVITKITVGEAVKI